MRILFEVENKKGAGGALVICAWRGNYDPVFPAMDVTDHGALDVDRDGDGADLGRYEVPWRRY
ncbi:hypothetical protein [Paraburkholderia sp. BL18I3N2]|uniref:hypothetical protein n=1 Tax=Paraburkholderia sp. BL18I3N2 TaxID=1938799 RepID=UPI0011B22B7E|nr:hypothetical protein [Paraburkholderia sp. BL18I3N2]